MINVKVEMKVRINVTEEDICLSGRILSPLRQIRLGRELPLCCRVCSASNGKSRASLLFAFLSSRLTSPTHTSPPTRMLSS